MAEAGNKILGKFNLGDRVTFQIYPVTLYGDIFRNCVPTDLISFKSTPRFNVDAAAEHAKVYNLLPPGQAPNDPAGYKWLVVTLENGDERVIGLPWIKVDTIQVIQVVNTYVTVPNTAPEDQEKIRLALSAAGFNDVEINQR
ncbi:hypothetical protein [Serratia phage vB_SmaM_Yaphecito]|uniref:SH3 fold domain-containing protein n=1 Tax=Serratia phage vB_SmaM_Yaphecito TaxID=2777368 RepID=A0A7T3TLY5_9CAUD|nr:hypothetical protein [Serratia phage vB_SmaM_Yaphecito]